MKKIRVRLKQFNRWFDEHFEWFFTNGNRYNYDRRRAKDS